jgi:hypothetical protein
MMSRKTVLMSAPLGLGGLVLLWAALAARSEAGPARPLAAPKPKPTPARIVETAPAPEVPGEARFVAAPSGPALSGGGENSLIEERIRKMEERLLTLEGKRNTLAGANQELERQINEKNVEASARMMAEFRVRGMEQQLGLSESQKQTLMDLWTKWQREEGGKPTARETWLAREQDIRSVLTAEQSAKMHEGAVQQTQVLWTHLGRSLGSMLGASKEEQTRFQQTLGDYRPANAMLLPEGYGADWPGMMREGASRLQQLLTPDQMTKLSRFIPK